MAFDPYLSTPLITPTKPQLYDIAALQSFYGRNESANSGDSVYNNFSAAGNIDDLRTIWDGGNSAAGGTDTIDASIANTASYVDLRPGFFSSLGPQSTVNMTGGATPVRTDLGKLNVAIAFATYIENAKGSDQNDLLVGNRLSNRLTGGAGSDIIYGDGYQLDAITADYRLIDQSPTHVANPTGTIGSLTSDDTLQKDVLLGGAGSDYTFGSNGVDQIFGGQDDDYLQSFIGKDLFHGGDDGGTVSTNVSIDGVDTLNYSVLSRADLTKGIRVVTATTAVDSTYSTNKDFLKASWVTDLERLDTDTLISVEKIIGTAADDIVSIRTLAAPRLAGTNGQGGIARIELGGQSRGDLIDLSQLTERATVDLSAGDASSVRATAASARTINIVGAEQVLGSNRGDTITGGPNAEVLAGGNGSDVIRGGGGSDRIFTGTGNDQLFGDAGDDTLIAEVGSAVNLTGGAGADTFWFPIDASRNRGGQVFDPEVGDVIVWNGYTIRGGTTTLVDDEIDPDTGEQVFWINRVGINGEIYIESGAGYNQVTIVFPDGGSVILENWQQGDAGITLSGPYLEAWTWDQIAALPKTNIVNDGLIYNINDITAVKASVANAGSIAKPSRPTSAGPTMSSGFTALDIPTNNRDESVIDIRLDYNLRGNEGIPFNTYADTHGSRLAAYKLDMLLTKGAFDHLHEASPEFHIL